MKFCAAVLNKPNAASCGDSFFFNFYLGFQMALPRSAGIARSPKQSSLLFSMFCPPFFFFLIKHNENQNHKKLQPTKQQKKSNNVSNSYCVANILKHLNPESMTIILVMESVTVSV